MNVQFSLTRYPHGWVLTSPTSLGVPVSALGEVQAMMQEKMFLNDGLLHHIRVTSDPKACFCFTSTEGGKQWTAEIRHSLRYASPEKQWWQGTDVGISSAAVFAVFSREFAFPARELGRESTPTDADDFGRCQRLLHQFPDWRKQIPRVAEAYPNSQWPRLLPLWPALECATDLQRNAILRDFHTERGI